MTTCAFCGDPVDSTCLDPTRPDEPERDLCYRHRKEETGRWVQASLLEQRPSAGMLDVMVKGERL